MAVAQAVNRNVYERTNELGRMLTSGQLAQAIRNEVKRQFARQEPETNILDVLPARAATSMRYDKRATTAVICNEGGKEEKIDLPLEDGWRKSDGNPFGVPNGAPSTKNDPDALYLYRRQTYSFSGPVGFGVWGDGNRRRGVDAYSNWSRGSGVALVGREATAPLVEVPKEALAKITDPKALLQRAEQLEAAAKELTERFGEIMTPESYARMIKPIVDEAAFVRELAGKIEAIQKA